MRLCQKKSYVSELPTSQLSNAQSSESSGNDYEPIGDLLLRDGSQYLHEAVANDPELIQDSGYEAVENILAEEVLEDMKNQRALSQNTSDFVLQEQRRLTLERQGLERHFAKDSDSENDYVDLN